MARPAPSVTNVTELSSEQSVASVAIDAAAEPDLDVEPDSETEVMKPVTVVAANPGSTNTFQPIFSDPLMNVPSAQSRETVLESLVNLFKHDPGGTNRIDKTILLPLHFLTVPDSKPLSSQATYSGP